VVRDMCGLLLAFLLILARLAGSVAAADTPAAPSGPIPFPCLTAYHAELGEDDRRAIVEAHLDGSVFLFVASLDDHTGL